MTASADSLLRHIRRLVAGPAPGSASDAALLERFVECRDEEALKPKEKQQARTDRYGDPLPPGALVRMGTVHSTPRRGPRRHLLGKMRAPAGGGATAAVGFVFLRGR